SRHAAASVSCTAIPSLMATLDCYRKLTECSQFAQSHDNSKGATLGRPFPTSFSASYSNFIHVPSTGAADGRRRSARLLADPVHLGPADRALPHPRRLAVLHRDLLRHTHRA